MTSDTLKVQPLSRWNVDHRPPFDSMCKSPMKPRRRLEKSSSPPKRSVWFHEGRDSIHDVVSFVDFVEDHHVLWYTKEDYAAIKAECRNACNQLRLGEPENETVCYRGLEFKLKEEARRRRSRMVKSLEVVLDQDDQHRTHDEVAAQYARCTSLSQIEAHHLGIADAEEAVTGIGHGPSNSGLLQRKKSPTREERHVSFDTTLAVYKPPHFLDEDEDNELLWYTQEDYDEIRNENRMEFMLLCQGAPEGVDVCYRGLEHRLKDISQQRNSRIDKATEIVLTFGSGGKNHHHAEKLAKRYARCSRSCQIEARHVGIVDAGHADYNTYAYGSKSLDSCPRQPARRWARAG